MEKHYFRVYAPGETGKVKMFCVFETDGDNLDHSTLQKWDYVTMNVTNSPIVDELRVGLQGEVSFLLGVLNDIKNLANENKYVIQNGLKILEVTENEFSCTEREFAKQVFGG